MKRRTFLKTLGLLTATPAIANSKIFDKLEPAELDSELLTSEQEVGNLTVRCGIPGAKVGILMPDNSMIVKETGIEGSVNFELPNGQYEVRIRRKGYMPAAFGADVIGKTGVTLPLKADYAAGGYYVGHRETIRNDRKRSVVTYSGLSV